MEVNFPVSSRFPLQLTFSKGSSNVPPNDLSKSLMVCNVVCSASPPETILLQILLLKAAFVSGFPLVTLILIVYNFSHGFTGSGWSNALWWHKGNFTLRSCGEFDQPLLRLRAIFGDLAPLFCHEHTLYLICKHFAQRVWPYKKIVYQAWLLFYDFTVPAFSLAAHTVEHSGLFCSLERTVIEIWDADIRA